MKSIQEIAEKHAIQGDEVEICEYLYLQYANNFLTVSRFAEYYGISECWANFAINIGRKKNHKKEVTKCI